MEEKTREQIADEMESMLKQLDESTRDEFMEIMRRYAEARKKLESSFDLIEAIQKSRLWLTLPKDSQDKLLAMWKNLPKD